MANEASITSVKADDRKSYVAPALTDYGSLATLTLGGDPSPVIETVPTAGSNS